MYDDEKRYQVLSRIDNGEKPVDVSESMDIGKATVIRWYKEYTNARAEGTLDKLLDIDKLILAQAELHKSSPEGLVEVIDDKVKTMTKGLTGLNRLDDEMQQTATTINNRIKCLIPSIEHASELIDLTDCLCKLRVAFFQKGTQVNVQNNYSSDENTGKYRNLLDDKPANN